VETEAIRKGCRLEKNTQQRKKEKISLPEGLTEEQKVKKKYRMKKPVIKRSKRVKEVRTVAGVQL